MEALVAVSLSSNILQFVDFAGELVRTASELRHNASTAGNRDHAVITEDLEAIAIGVRDSAQAINGAPLPSPEENTLLPVAKGCCKLAKELLTRLESCGVNTQQKDSRFQRVKHVFKCMWNKREIEDINTRLQYFRSQLDLHMTYGIRQAQAQSYASQASRDDVRDLGTSLQALQLKSETDTTQILQSLAEVKVENSRFHAQVTQAAPVASISDTSLQHLIRSVFDEYEERMLVGVEKRFRRAAQSELGDTRESLLQALPEKQAEVVKKSIPISSTSDEDCALTTQRRQDSSQDESFNPSKLSHDRRENAKLKKRNTTIIFREDWEKCTSFGTIWLHFVRSVVFSNDRPTTCVHTVTAHLIPSPRWLTTGFSITYQNSTDPRGNPRFILQPQTYRVLDDHHQIWGVINRDDTDSLKMMLSQRIVSPFDRASGYTLLNLAVKFGSLRICQILIESGADVNATSGNFSAILDALIPITYFKDGGAKFRYLRSQPGIDLGIFWDDHIVTMFLLNLLFSYVANTTAQLLLLDVPHLIDQWIYTCKEVEFDFNTSRRAFLECAVSGALFSIGVDISGGYLNQWPNRDYLDIIIEMFDALVRKVESTDFLRTQKPTIPVAYAVVKMVLILSDAQENRSIAATASPDLHIFYRGHYVSRVLAIQLKFLEHIISIGIADRPDCIFDSCCNITIYDWFWDYDWEGIWDQILEEHGFDPEWVMDEDERRKRVVTGETSAHEVSLGSDVGQAQQMTRRRAYEREE